MVGAETDVPDAKALGSNALKFDMLKDEDIMLGWTSLMRVDPSCSGFQIFCDVDTQLVDAKRTRQRSSL